MTHHTKRTLAAFACTLIVAGCGDDDAEVESEADAERAYVGLDESIDKAIDLGFDGFNAASNANIPDQVGQGTASGTITISGKVDQGSSANKTMNLTEALEQYSDDGKLVYETGATLPTIDIKLNAIPNGTLNGSMAGTYGLSGELQGTVTLSLAFTGELEPGTGDTLVQRKPGSTHITGTAKSGFGVYAVDVTR